MASLIDRFEHPPEDQEMLLQQLTRNAEYWEQQAQARVSPRSVAAARKHRDQCIVLAKQIKRERARSAGGDDAKA